jgi:iron(III) transport system substrate-binding protein
MPAPQPSHRRRRDGHAEITMLKQILVLLMAGCWATTTCATNAASVAPVRELNVICSVQVEWCRVLETVFSYRANVKVNMVYKGSGDALAQLVMERAAPHADLWFGGTGDPHMQAAEQDLTATYRSPLLPRLHPWSQMQAKQSGFRTVGLYAGPLGFAFNTKRLEARHLPLPRSWADLIKPEYKDEVQVANPASSGTAYVMIATLVQLMGEEQAFVYMKALHKNVKQYPRSGTAPLKAVARGEASVSISFMHDGPGERLQGFPVETIAPSEGTGAEIGSMSIVKGGPNPAAARDFYEWVLEPAVQQIAFASRQFQLPSSTGIVAVDRRVPDFTRIKLIDYNYARYGASAERKRLIARWERDVLAAPR